MSRSRLAALILGLFAVYFVAGKLGLRLAFMHPSATPVWPPTGITLAAFLLLGYRVWPGILAGAFLVNLTTAGSVATSAGIAFGNTLEGIAGAYLVRRFANGAHAFERAQDVFSFMIAAALMSTAVSATFGVTTLCLGGVAGWADYGSIWLTWWLGDAVGNLVVAPVLILWAVHPRGAWSGARILESAIFLLCLFLVGQIVFGDPFSSRMHNYPLVFLCTPFLIWSVFRFSQRETATSILLLSAMAIQGTLDGFGPFAMESPNESLLVLQTFTGINSMMILALGAVVSERQKIEEMLRRLAVTDPLTGLANRRGFTGRLKEEIKRSERSGRPFSILLFDLDGLKPINDRLGHLKGDRALIRLARTLRADCRSVDVAGRLGGDEFTLMLIDTGELGAAKVGARVCKSLKMDPETPALSVSLGVAVYPRGGRTVRALLETADREMYRMKREKFPPVEDQGTPDTMQLEEMHHPG